MKVRKGQEGCLLILEHLLVHLFFQMHLHNGIFYNVLCKQQSTLSMPVTHPMTTNAKISRGSNGKSVRKPVMNRAVIVSKQQFYQHTTKMQ